jgi:hypothetical protein
MRNSSCPELEPQDAWCKGRIDGPGWQPKTLEASNCVRCPEGKAAKPKNKAAKKLTAGKACLALVA